MPRSFVSFWFFLTCWLLVSIPAGAAKIDKNEMGSDQPVSVQKRSDAALNQARLFGLGSSEAWQSILFFHPRVWGSRRGLVDSPEFYLADNGISDAHAELEAFLIQLFETPEENVACRFPRRYKWLTAQLAEHLPYWPDPECPQDPLESLNLHRVTGVSLVFSSYFLESPASFFGHLFLRFEQGQGSKNRNPMLDPILGFSAVHGEVDPFTYIIGGLVGWFPGLFEQAPMYLKIQQYTNHESRDLWEYPLSLSEEELEDLLLSFFEVRQMFSWYTYFSRNCSLLLARLIEAARPELGLSARYRLWSTPPDILKAIVEEVGSSDQFRYYPSNRARYVHHYGLLSESEKKTFSLLVEDHWETLDSSASEVQARVLDTFIEFIDFSMRVSGAESGGELAAARNRALLKRAGMDIRPIPEPEAPAKENPVSMQPEQRLGLGIYRNEAQGGSLREGVLLQWRPTLRSLLSQAQGSRPQIAMEMMDLELLLEEKKGISLLWLGFLNIENYLPRVPHRSLYNLNFSFGLGHFDGVVSEPFGSINKVGFVHSYDLGAFGNAFWGLDGLAWMSVPWRKSVVGMEPNIGVLVLGVPKLPVYFRSGLRWNALEAKRWEWVQRLRASLHLAPQWEVGLEVQQSQFIDEEGFRLQMKGVIQHFF